LAAFGLHWVRAEGAERCIDPQSLAQRVEGLIGPVFVSPSAAQRFIEGEVRAEKRGFRVRLRLLDSNHSASNERTFGTDGADCHQLDAMIAFIIALTIEPGLSLADVPPEVLAQFAQEIPPEETLLAELEQTPSVVAQTAHADPEAPAPPAEETALEPPASKPAPESERPVRSLLALGGAALFGTLPGVTPGAQASYAREVWRSVALQLGARAFFDVTPSDLAGGQSARFQAYELALSLCSATSLVGALRVRGCVGPALARLDAQGLGFDNNKRGQLWDPNFNVVVGLLLTFQNGFGLLAEAGARVRFGQTAFELAQGDGTRRTAFTPARVGASLSFGPVYEF
jgi:hypothetical protein